MPTLSAPARERNAPDAPDMLPVIAESIPAQLRECPAAWAPWKKKPREGKPGKFDKVPCVLSREHGLSTKHPWFRFDRALASYEEGLLFGEADGIGFNVTHERTLVALDLDDCIGTDGALEPWAREIVGKAKSYTERSPSGRGVRIMLRASIPEDWTNHERGVEVYGGNALRFVTITGHRIDGTPGDVAEAPEGFLEWLATTYRTTKARSAARPIPSMPALPESVPDLATLVLDPRVREFLDDGVSFSGDRSGDLRHATFGLFAALPESLEREAIVLAILCDAPGAWSVALDHRSNDAERAQAYLWEHHVCHVARWIDDDEADTLDALPELDDLPSSGPAERYLAHLQEGKCIYLPTGALFPNSSVNAHVPEIGGMKPAAYFAKHKPIHQETWAPGHPRLMHDAIVDESGVRPCKGNHVYNRYRPPAISRGSAIAGRRWRDLLRRNYGEDADHIEKVLAAKVQKPGVKVNHALVLGGAPGIGKDTLLEPFKRAVGAWNWTEISPLALMGQFNAFVRSVVLRISEARDLGAVDRYRFYEHCKTLIAAPPDVLRVNEKHRSELQVPNVVLVVFTTNNRHNALYLPADDRRHFVAWSTLTRDEFNEEFWLSFWHWIDNGGDAHVGEYLRTLDLSGFNPKAPPPHTGAFLDLVAGGLPEDAHAFNDALARLGDPQAVTAAMIKAAADDPFALNLESPRRIPHRMQEAGFSLVRNPDQKDGRWWIDGANQAVFVRVEITREGDRITAAQALARGAAPPQTPQ